MAVGKVSDADFESEVLNATGPVVVDFWAEWCGPCRMIAPALDEISGVMGDKVKIVKLNVDESPKTASKYGVMSIPTLMIFKGLAPGRRGAKAEAAAVDYCRGLIAASRLLSTAGDHVAGRFVVASLRQRSHRTPIAGRAKALFAPCPPSSPWWARFPFYPPLR
jgi:thioredoxin 1